MHCVQLTVPLWPKETTRPDPWRGRIECTVCLALCAPVFWIARLLATPVRYVICVTVLFRWPKETCTVLYCVALRSHSFTVPKLSYPIGTYFCSDWLKSHIRLLYFTFGHGIISIWWESLNYDVIVQFWALLVGSKSVRYGVRIDIVSASNRCDFRRNYVEYRYRFDQPLLTVMYGLSCRSVSTIVIDVYVSGNVRIPGKPKID